MMIEHPKASPRPHVVLLGAGASRAAFPNGDRASRPIPLMNDLVELLELSSVLGPVGSIENENFESIYSQLDEAPRYERERREVERRVADYFSSLELPEEATIYDKLLLSLGPEDVVFTFNWDPFLFDAYERNFDKGVRLPEIFFLHGNVRIGACRKHPGKWGRRRVFLCPDCGELFDDVPLLYPVKKKGYSSDPYIAGVWESAQLFFREAFVLTIFGYSGPDSDRAALDLLKSSWMERSDRKFEYVEVVDIAPTDDLHERWSRFTPTHHLQLVRHYEESFVGRWPRCAKENLHLATFLGKPSFNRPLADTDDLAELQAQVREIARRETDGGE